MKEFTNWKQFSSYLIELEKNQKEKPFDCYQLTVSPEDILYKIEEGVLTAYRKGSLMCHSLAFMSEGRRSLCSINSPILTNDSGELEVLCSGYNCGYLTIKIEKFRRPI